MTEHRLYRDLHVTDDTLEVLLPSCLIRANLCHDKSSLPLGSECSGHRKCPLRSRRAVEGHHDLGLLWTAVVHFLHLAFLLMVQEDRHWAVRECLPCNGAASQASTAGRSM